MQENQDRRLAPEARSLPQHRNGVRSIETYVGPFDEAPLDNPHNSYLQMTVYAGLPALAAFILANGALLWRAGRVSVRNADDGSPQAVFGFAIGLAGFLASAYPDMHLFTRDVGTTPARFITFLALRSDSSLK